MHFYFSIKTTAELLYLAVFLIKTTMTNTKNAMNFGAILGLALCVLHAVYMNKGLETNFLHSIFSFVTALAFAIWGSIWYRDKQNGGFLSFGQSYLSCLLITIFSSIIVAFFIYIYLSFFDQSFIDEVLQKTEEEMLNKKMPDDQIERGMEIARTFASPIMMAIMTIVFNLNLLLMLFFGLIVSLIIKRENPNFNNFIKENQ
jgi:hypothetical protein